MNKNSDMKNTKIAVLIPVKNNASTIVRALDSVVNQTYFKDLKKEYVIYLVDDASSDGLYDLIKGFDNLIYLKNKNSGISSALNTGIFKIMNDDSIEYIARLDGDDEWHLNKIEIQMDFLNKNSDIDICGTGVVLLGKTNTIYGVYAETNKEIYDCVREKNQNPICHPSVILNKRIFYLCGVYDDTNLGAEDFNLWKRCMNFNYNFYNIKDYLINVTAKEVDFISLGLNY